VDTGNQDMRLAAALGRAGVVCLDGLLVTHHDDDHCGSMPVLSSSLAGGRLYLAEEMLCQTDARSLRLLELGEGLVGHEGMVGLALGDELVVGRFSCRVVWPRAFEDEGGNADSLCLLVSHDADSDGVPEHRALLTGDAEAEQLKAACAAGDVEDVDLLKLGHHGSRAGTTPELVEMLRPEAAFVSVGAHNPYGHPTPEALEALSQGGCELWRSDENGDVSCAFYGDRMEISPMR